MLSRRNTLQLFGVSAVAASLPGCDAISGASSQFRYASPAPVWWNAAPLIAQTMGLYEAKGLNLVSFDVATGTRSKEAVVTGNAEVGVAAPNSFSTASKAQLKDMVILCNTMNSRSTVSILHRGLAPDWENGTIGLVPGTIAEFYLISYLRSRGKLDLYTNGKLNIVGLSPNGVATAFGEGEIDIAAIWEPFPTQIKNADFANVNVIRSDDLYQQQIYLLSKRSVFKNNLGEIAEMRAALRAACDYIQENREKTAEQLEAYFDFTPGFLSSSEAWKKTNFSYTDDPSLMIEALRSDFEIAKIAGTTEVDDFEVIAQALSEIRR